MKVLDISNPIPLEYPYTVISSAYSSGTSLTVEDSTGFIDNDLILVGGIGNEKTEVTDLTATPSNVTTLTITALSFAHSEDESIQKVPYNKFNVDYRTSSTGDWTSVTTNQDFDWGREATQYTHETGADTYEYRVRYYNSATAQYSGYSGTAPADGYDRNQVGHVVKRIKSKIPGIANIADIDQQIIDDINSLHDIIKGMNRKWWFLKESYTYDTVASTRRYDLPTGFERLDYVTFNYVSGTSIDETYRLIYRPQIEFDALYTDNDADDDDSVTDFTIDLENSHLVLGKAPATAGLDFTLYYYETITDVDSFDDTLIIPLPDIYYHYVAAEMWNLKNDPKQAKYHEDRFEYLLQVLNQMRNKINQTRQLKKFMGQKYRNQTYGRHIVNEEDW